MRSITLPGAIFLLASILARAPAALRPAPRRKKRSICPRRRPTRFATREQRARASCCSRVSPRTASRNSSTNSRTSTRRTRKATDRLNSLINGYTGCIDDAADLIEIGIEKQQDIRDGVKALQAGIKEFLPYLQDLAANGPERETYKENLDDAIEATQDAAKDVEKASKEMAAPPVRRKPS